MPCDAMTRKRIRKEVKQMTPNEVEEGFFEFDGASLEEAPKFKRVVSKTQVPTETNQDMFDRATIKLTDPMYIIRKKHQDYKTAQAERIRLRKEQEQEQAEKEKTTKQARRPVGSRRQG